MPAPGGARRKGAIAAAPSREVGAVLAFRPTRAMPIGHVAVVAEIVDEPAYLPEPRQLVRAPAASSAGALAEDVSENGDWSVVRVWYAPQRSLGLRANPTFGFIYNEAPGTAAPAVAAADDDRRPRLGRPRPGRHELIQPRRPGNRRSSPARTGNRRPGSLAPRR